MADEKFQVIVIGAGLAGIAAAYRLAEAGKEVMLVDRGEYPGAKNVSGGRIYTYALKKLMPETWQHAPLEREIKREIMMMMTDADSMMIDTTFASPKAQSFSVLRSSFDAWLASQAEEAGAMLIPGTTVDGLLIRDQKVCGIQTGGETIEADLVIDAEGVNAWVAERAGLRPKVAVNDIAVGVKCVFKLSETSINERFNVSSGEGAAMLCAGDCTQGISGGAFFYTNRESISTGIVADTSSLKASGLSLTDMLERYLRHPAIARYLSGAELIEYSAHLIPEGGFQSLPPLYANGFLIAGDAAGFVINRGFTVRGMDYALMSGIAAAETAIGAIDADDFSKEKLKIYQDKLEPTVLKDLKTLKHAHDYIAHSKYLFTTYPQLATDLMSRLYTADGTPSKSVISMARQMMKDDKVPLFHVLKDAFKGSRSL